MTRSKTAWGNKYKQEVIMGFLAIAFIIDVLVSTVCMWVATKFSFVKAEFKILALIVFAVALVSLIPVVGWIAAILLFIFAIMKVSNCGIVDALWVVIFTKLFSFIIVLGVRSIT